MLVEMKKHSLNYGIHIHLLIQYCYQGGETTDATAGKL